MSTVDENYKRMRAELDEALSKDKRLAAIVDKIARGKADFNDTALYTQIVSKHMSDVIKRNIGSIKVPMGKEMVCKELLRDHYELINGVFGEVQVSVDEKLGIHLNPIKPAYPEERVNSWAHSLEDPTVEQNVTERRAASGSENIGNSMHDACIKENAKVREQAGLDCYLVRDAGGGCCPWCQALEGRYSYADAPDDIFRRHDNCTCTVTYVCGRKRQQVWSKQDWSNNKEREYLKRLDAEKAAKRKALSDNSKPKVNSKEQAQAINEQSKSNITVFSKEQAEALNKQNQPVKFTQAEAKEREAKALDKSQKSGIIREGSNQKPITEITDSAIERVPNVKISGYTDEQCAEIQKQHKELLEYSRKNNGGNEVAFVFDGSLGNRKEYMGSDDKIDFGTDLTGKNLILLHNHPRSSSYSFNDVVEFFGNDSLKTITIVKNNGKVETLTKIGSYDKLDILKSLDRIKNDIKKKAPKPGEFRDGLYRKETLKFLNKHHLGGLVEWIK